MASEQDIKNQQRFNDELRESRKLTQDEIQELAEIRGVIQANINELTNSNKVKSDSLKSSRQLQSISETLLQDAREEFELDEKGLDKLNKKLDLERQNLEQNLKSSELKDEERGNFENTLSLANQLIERTQQRLQLEKDIVTAGGLAGGIAGSLQASLDKIGAGKLTRVLGIDDALKKNKEFTKDIIKGGAQASKLSTKFAVAGDLIGHLGKNLSKSLGPIALIAELVNGIKAADEQTNALGKSMSMTKGESALFRENLAEAARDSGNMAVTGTKMVENFSALNQQLGFINNFTTDTLVTMTKLTEQVKLSKESAGALVTLSEARGTNAERDYKAALGASYELQRQSGIQQDLKVILEGVAKISGQLRANLGANTVEMAKAVTLAGELGGELSDVQTISKSILNFESSIAAELEAELLTGKELNLERARYAALTGDIVGLEKEIADQLGSFTEFSKMNVIQQEAMAAAFGLSSDRLSDMLFKQQVMGRSAKELRAAGEDELAQMLEQQTLQDKFNQSVLKLKEIFADVGTAFMPFIELLGVALSLVGVIAALITDILSFFKGDFDFSATDKATEATLSQLGLGTGKSTTSLESESSRPAQSKSGNSSGGGSRTDELLEKLLAKDTNLYMNDSKLNDAMNTSNVSYALGS